MKLLILIFLVALTSGSNSNPEKVKYDDYKVHRITPINQSQLKILQQLQNRGISFWKEPSFVDRHADMMLSPLESQRLIPILQRSGMKVEQFVSNVQKLIDDTEVKIEPRQARLTWDSYHTLDEVFKINSFLEEQASAHNLIASTFSIGQSTEGRELKVLKVSKSGETKPAIFVDANIHAREWLTSALATYIIDQVLNSNDTQIQSWSDDFDWYFLPVLNVDGFDYTHTTNRMWRKTRSLHPDSPCIGVDGNRNFDYHWLEDSTSLEPCSETFAGVNAFSEPETTAVKDFLTQLGDRLMFYLTLHTYGQQIVFPYGYTHDHIPEYDTFYALTKAAAEKHSERFGTEFTYGTSVGLYSGFSIDYAFGVLNADLALLYELRDTGSYGFLVPPNQIVPSALEFLDGLQLYIDALRSGNLTSTKSLPHKLV